MTQKTEPQSPLQFPCEFMIKVFGHASDQFELEVLTIIRKHVQDLRENALSVRPSKDGKYLALTIKINAESKDQLDDIYRDLSRNPHILMAL
jgi:putative lipoic acid-binding regulatory protein